MSEIIDGSYDSPQGRKVFVTARAEESSEDFAERAMAMLSWAGHPFADVQDEARSDDLAELALCPDGVTRAYSLAGEVAFVEVRGSRIEGQITEVDGVTRFRPSARHHGAHLMWFPTRVD